VTWNRFALRGDRRTTRRRAVLRALLGPRATRQIPQMLAPAFEHG